MLEYSESRGAALLNEEVEPLKKTLGFTGNEPVRTQSFEHRPQRSTQKFSVLSVIPKRNALTHGGTPTVMKTGEWLYSKSRQSFSTV